MPLDLHLIEKIFLVLHPIRKGVVSFPLPPNAHQDQRIYMRSSLMFSTPCFQRFNSIWSKPIGNKILAAFYYYFPMIWMLVPFPKPMIH